MSKVDYLEILRLQALHYSKNRISASVHSSHHTVEDVIPAAAAAGLSWPLDDDVTNEDIQEILFPGKHAYASPYTVPDFQYIHEELAKKGVTLTLLWEEYCQRVRTTGGVPYMYTQFCEKYRRCVPAFLKRVVYIGSSKQEHLFTFSFSNSMLKFLIRFLAIMRFPHTFCHPQIRKHGCKA